MRDELYRAHDRSYRFVSRLIRTARCFSVERAEHNFQNWKRYVLSKANARGPVSRYTETIMAAVLPCMQHHSTYSIAIDWGTFRAFGHALYDCKFSLFADKRGSKSKARFLMPHILSWDDDSGSEASPLSTFRLAAIVRLKFEASSPGLLPVAVLCPVYPVYSPMSSSARPHRLPPVVVARLSYPHLHPAVLLQCRPLPLPALMLSRRLLSVLQPR